MEMLGNEVVGLVNKELIATIFTYVYIGIFCLILIIFTILPLYMVVKVVKGNNKKWLD